MRDYLKRMKNNLIWIIVLIWEIVGLIFAVGYWIFTWQGLRWQTLDWQVLAGFASWILAGGLFIAIWQIIKTGEDTRKSNNAQVAVQLFDQLRSAESKETLRFIYNDLKSQDIEQLHKRTGDDKEKRFIDGLLDKFEMLASLINHGIVDKPLAIEAFGGAPALRCWYKLEPYIRKETCKRGYYVDNYEDFTRLCLDYFIEKQIPVRFFEDGREDSPTDLVEFFTEMGKADKRYPRTLEEIRRERQANS